MRLDQKQNDLPIEVNAADFPERRGFSICRVRVRKQGHTAYFWVDAKLNNQGQVIARVTTKLRNDEEKESTVRAPWFPDAPPTAPDMTPDEIRQFAKDLLQNPEIMVRAAASLVDDQTRGVEPDEVQKIAVATLTRVIQAAQYMLDKITK